MGLASLIVRLGLDATNYNVGMKRAESATAKFSSVIKSQLAGVFAVGAITAYAKSLTNFASHIQDITKRTQLSAETIQEWNYAAEQTGTNLDTIVRGYEYMARMNPKLTNDQVLKQFYELSRLVKEGAISNELGYVTKLLGRGGGELIPMFREGFQEIGEDARRLGIIMENDVIAKLDSFADKMVELKARLRGPVGTGLAEAGSFLADVANKAAATVSYASAFLGASTRTSLNEASKIAFDQAFGSQAKAEMQKFVTSLRGKPTMFNTSADKAATSETTIEQSRKWMLGSTTSNQQIGAFNAAQPILITETKEQTRQLKKIADNTDALKKEWDNS